MSSVERPILRLVERYRANLARGEAEAARRLVTTYRGLYARLQDKIELLIAELESRGETPGRIYRSQRYMALMTQVNQELADWGVVTRAELERVAQVAVDAGLADSGSLLTASGVTAGFDTVNREVMTALLGFLDPAGPLYQRINVITAGTAEAVSKAILEGVGLGYNPRKIAANITRALGMGLTDALRNVRTVQLWAYRESNRANFVANSDIITGWVWFAELESPRTCMSCVVMHGTEHALTETLDDHYNGRCAMIPMVYGYNPVTESGETWFESLPPAEQQARMGQGMWDAWKDGAFALSDIPGEYDSPVYGTMRVEKSLRELTQ